MPVKALRLTLSLLISAGIITACSQQAPNLSGNPTVNQNGDTAGTSQSEETRDIIANNQDDETTIRDSETVAEGEGNFSVQSFSTKDDDDDGDNGRNKDDKDERKELRREAKDHKEFIRDREKALMDRIRSLEAQLRLVKNIDRNKLSRLERKNIKVDTSNVVEVRNSDGTLTKIVYIKFQNQNDNTFRESKLSRTFDVNGRLISSEYLLTVNNNNLTRTYFKHVDFNFDGSRDITVKSETRWNNGKIRTVNEVRHIDANGNGFGNGTVVIVKQNGETSTFNFNFTITGRNIHPLPTTPFPTLSPLPTVSPTTITVKGFLSGRISLGPLCPVEPCNFTDAQLQAFFAARKIQVYTANRASLVTEFFGDKNGNYQIELPVGTYIVDTVSTGIGASNLPQTVHINAGFTTTLNISIDTGIR